MANDKRKRISPLAAGVAGAAIGAAAATAAIALSNKKTRQKIGKKIKELSNAGKLKYAEVKEDVQAAVKGAKEATRTVRAKRRKRAS